MLVEDAADTRDLVIAILEMDGHTIETSETGEDALNKIRTLQPDVILMDMSLPGNLSGLDVVRELRADEAFVSTPILALTAHAMIEDRRRSLAVGCDEHITKPIFDLEEFTAVISGYVAQGRKFAERIRAEGA